MPWAGFSCVMVWLAIALGFLAQFGALGSIFDSGSSLADAWGLVSFVGLAGVLLSSGLLAWAGARFFQDTRRQQDLELLLATPIGRRDILSGRWRVLRRALAWPLGVMLALALPAGISLVFEVEGGHLRQVWFLLPTFLIAVNLAVEAVALSQVGICFGLRARTLMGAVVRTVGLVQLLPLAVAVALMWSWGVLTDHVLPPLRSRGQMPAVVPALLFFLAKNVALIVWARLRLHRDLRLGTKAARLDRSARRLVLQPA